MSSLWLPILLKKPSLIGDNNPKHGFENKSIKKPFKPQLILSWSANSCDILVITVIMWVNIQLQKNNPISFRIYLGYIWIVSPCSPSDEMTIPGCPTELAMRSMTLSKMLSVPGDCRPSGPAYHVETPNPKKMERSNLNPNWLWCTKFYPIWSDIYGVGDNLGTCGNYYWILQWEVEDLDPKQRSLPSKSPADSGAWLRI